jgi:hypothetical protein
MFVEDMEMQCSTRPMCLPFKGVKLLGISFPFVDCDVTVAVFVVGLFNVTGEVAILNVFVNRQVDDPTPNFSGKIKLRVTAKLKGRENPNLIEITVIQSSKC